MFHELVKAKQSLTCAFHNEQHTKTHNHLSLQAENKVKVGF